MNQEKRMATIAGIAAVAVIVIIVLIMQAPRITKPTPDNLLTSNTNQINSNKPLTNETGTNEPSTNQPSQINTNQPTESQPSMNSLEIKTVKAGSGPAAQNGNTVTVHYTGTLTDGTKFDSSRDRGTPFSFTLGQGRVIQGWEQGVLGMKVGEQRKLTIPSDLGYGDSGYPPAIPPKATLLFDIELISIN